MNAPMILVKMEEVVQTELMPILVHVWLGTMAQTVKVTLMNVLQTLVRMGVHVLIKLMATLVLVDQFTPVLNVLVSYASYLNAT